jgi:hypothetical protein
VTAILVLIALGTCLRYAQTARNFVVTPDGTEYLRTAVAFEREGGAALKVGLRQPLYPLALWTAGRAAEAVDPAFEWRHYQMAEVGRLAGVVFYVPFLAAAWFFFRRFLDVYASAVCLSVVMIHPLFGSHFANVLSETVYLSFFASGLACLALALDSGRRGTLVWAFLAGLSAALAFFTRVEGQILLVSALFCIFFVGTKAAEGATRLSTRRRALSAVCCAGGFVGPVIPVALFLGVTSQRYSWEWIWRRLVGGEIGSTDAVSAGLGLVATPFESAWMLIATLFEAAPVITISVLAFGLAGGARNFRERLSADWAPRHSIVVVTLALYVGVIIAGTSFRLGTVSSRYVQPLVLMALPLVAVFCNALFKEKFKSALRARRGTALLAAIGLLAYLAALAEAGRRWEHSKTGYRDAGKAIAERSSTVRLITTSPRLSYYAENPFVAVSPQRLKDSVLSGEAREFELVGIETKVFETEELDRLRDALELCGFGGAPWLDIGECSSGDRVDRRILVYRKAEVIE